jgi:uncharacterized SAM-binding protein YcdF (DUF218 family)
MRFNRDQMVRTALISLVLGILAIIFTAHPIVLRELAEFWIVSDKLEQPAGAVVILGGGLDQRPRAAADLYKRGLAREVWITHDNSTDNLLLPSVVNPTRATLVKLGIPDTVIVDVPGPASNTYDEAKVVSLWPHTASVKSLIIPTDAFHTRRTKWTFEKFLGARNIKLVVQPIYSRMNYPEKWWRGDESRTNFGKEVVKYAYYRLKY